MKRKNALVILIAALVLVGCTTATATQAPTSKPVEKPSATTKAAVAPTATTGEKVELTFWSWVPSIQDQVDEWNAANPNIHINYVNAGNGNTEMTKLNTSLEANSDIPDIVQIEYQHLPSYIAKDALLDLTAYGANDVKDKFVPWTWTQVSQGSGVYAYPQDSGPMVMFCNDAVLSKDNVAVPTTWDEFTAASAALHKADASAYLSNFTSDQGWFFGMLWASGAHPFTVNGADININFTSNEAMRVATLWGSLLKSGDLSPIDTYTSDWNTALGNGTIACWQAGAWGTYISGNSPDYAGKWNVYLMPQWTAGGKVNGNYGGSTIAVAKATKHPAEAALFDQWLNTDATATLELTNPDKAGLFPVTLATLANPTWSDVKYDFWSGKAIHQVMAEASKQIDPGFGWSPFTSFVYTTYGDDLVKVRAGSMTFEELMQDLQTKCVQYAKDQGFTVSEG
jgi:multiple sugar transport system substrate-binding protein